MKKNIYKKRFAFLLILLAGGIAAGVLWNQLPFNGHVKKLAAKESPSINASLSAAGPDMALPAPPGQASSTLSVEQTAVTPNADKNKSVTPAPEIQEKVTTARVNQRRQPGNKIADKIKNLSYQQDDIYTDNRALTINPTTLPGDTFHGELLTTAALNKTDGAAAPNVDTTIVAETYAIVKLVQGSGTTKLMAGGNTGNINGMWQPELHLNSSITNLPVQLRPEKSAWRLGFIVSGGVAVRREEVLSLKLSENKSLSYLNYFNTPTGSNTSQNNYNGWGAQNRVNSQSAILPGTSFSVNGFAERKVSKKIAISAGLGYGYLSDKIKTGNTAQNNLSVTFDNNRVENINKAFSAGENVTHTNRFHFIDLPVSLHWQLNNSKKLPLYLGVTSQLSYLAAVKALHYNSGYSGIYIEYNDAFNKWQHKIGTGIMAGFNLKGIQLKAGPQLFVNTSKVLQKQFLPKQHFMNGGLMVQVYLK